jgi:phosphate transport system substrate-binding protein
VKPGQLKMSGDLLAKIYLGKVTKWNAPEIAVLNPGVKLPADDITVVHRADGSGTTFIWTNFLFTDYLSKVSPEFADKVGAATAVEWPVGLGAKGNEGVANSVKQTSGAIGYVEFAYAEQNKLPHASLINAAGKKVEPTMDSFRSAAASADWASAPGYYLILTNQQGEGSWPITGATFILMHKQPKDAEATREALKFFDWAYKSGDDMAEALDYVPMPDNVVQAIEKTWTQQIQASGKPVYGG